MALEEQDQLRWGLVVAQNQQSPPYRWNYRAAPAWISLRSWRVEGKHGGAMPGDHRHIAPECRSYLAPRAIPAQIRAPEHGRR